MPRPSHLPWLCHRNNIWWRVQVTEALHYTVFSCILSLSP
jgi:hypothetical protein